MTPKATKTTRQSEGLPEPINKMSNKIGNKNFLKHF
jgi:hypothetical protein